ncbi:hypothetical protein VTN00DRAFT_3348 [Thermoascus crustaceus]|uniref:uncharacterized protein n=1 Tax=Thermoascus crustaceus TaxID=5088 RepID=UPI0037427A81
MRSPALQHAALLLCAIPGAFSLPKNHTDSLVNAAIDSGRFQNPSANVRPRFRYWIPDASVDPDRAAEDIKEAGQRGAGGVEILGYYLYNSAPGDYVPVDWTTYGWGTPTWKKLFDTLARAHKDNGLIMDFAMGPNQGQGVPAPDDSDGLMWDLHAYNISVPIGGSFSGQLPGWGAGKLQAAITGLAISSVNVSGLAPSLPNNVVSNRTQITLSTESLQDITSQVSPDGTVAIQFPSDKTGIEHTIFAIYLVKMHYRNEADPTTLNGPHTVPHDIVHNGSWAVDHFSSSGAKVMTEFWEKYLLVNGTKELLMEVGNYAWEDSVEIPPNLYWTKYLPDVFEKNRGYSINRWLPILFHQNVLGFDSSPDTWWITDEVDAGNSHIGDYRTTLAELYAEYLTALNSWAEEYLDIQFSAQVSYNMAMDMQHNIPNVDAPECESLGFNHLIDGYRQYAGPANLAGKRIISTECGANRNEVYQQTLPSLLWDVRRCIAGSVNQFVLHGYPYSGPYGNTTWPGFTTFNYEFSDMHGRHQPAWDFYKDSMNFIARLSYIFQNGVPRRDLAFYSKMTTYPNIWRNYQPVDLEEAGYTYEYISPDNFVLPEAYVKGGIFAPDRQEFKALVVRANDSMTVDGVTKLAEYAHSGLPILFSGGLPSYLVSYNISGAAYVNRTLASLTSLENVHVVPYEDLAGSVASIGIRPKTRVSADRIWYTYWRYDGSTSTEYIFVYNDAAGLPLGQGSSKGTVEFESTGVPYLYDAWTGEQKPILNYKRSSTTTTIPFRLAGNQSIIVAFHPSSLETVPLPSTHVTSTSGPVLAVSYDSVKGLIAHIGAALDATVAQIATSIGDTHIFKATASPFSLSKWTLTAEHWDPPADLSDIDTIAVKSNTTHSVSKLVSWQEIEGLQNVSGRGYYKTTFTWPPSSPSDGASIPPTGAYITFPPIVHTLRVLINSHPLPPLDDTAPEADISQYLVPGDNTVEAIVATTLVNRLRPFWYDLQTSGLGTRTSHFGGTTALPEARDYGLIGEVWVKPFAEVKIPT